MADTDYVVAYINKTTVPGICLNSCAFPSLSRFLGFRAASVTTDCDAAISPCPLGGVGGGGCTGIRHLFWAAVPAQAVSTVTPAPQAVIPLGHFVPGSDKTMTLSPLKPRAPWDVYYSHSVRHCHLWYMRAAPYNTCPFHGNLHPVKLSRVHDYELSFGGILVKHRRLYQVGCVTGGGQMARRLPDLSFRGRLIVS